MHALLRLDVFGIGLLDVTPSFHILAMGYFMMFLCTKFYFDVLYTINTGLINICLNNVHLLQVGCIVLSVYVEFTCSSG